MGQLKRNPKKISKAKMDIYQLRNIFSLSYTNYTHYNPFCCVFLNYTGLRMASTVLVSNGLKFRVTQCDRGFPVLAIFQANPFPCSIRAPLVVI
jgi:hypothetical protein